MIGLLFVISDVLENVFCDRFVICNIRCSGKWTMCSVIGLLFVMFWKICDRFVICNIRCSGKCVCDGFVICNISDGFVICSGKCVV